MNDLLNKEVTVLVANLDKPLGGIVLEDNDRFLILRAHTGNEIRIPQSKINSILIKTYGGTNNEQVRENS